MAHTQPTLDGQIAIYLAIEALLQCGLPQASFNVTRIRRDFSEADTAGMLPGQDLSLRMPSIPSWA